MAQHQSPDQSMAELVRQASEQTAALVRQELRLAQLELQEKGKRAGLGVGLIRTGGLLVLSGLAVLIAAAVLALALVVPPWAPPGRRGRAARAAGVLALTGKKQVDQARPPVPEEAIASTRRDIDEVRQRGRR